MFVQVGSESGFVQDLPYLPVISSAGCFFVLPSSEVCGEVR